MERWGWVIGIAAVLLVGWACAPAPAGSERLWEQEQTAHRAGWQWAQGVELSGGRHFAVTRSGARFRSRILNPGSQDRELVISGPDFRQLVMVAAGASSDVDTDPLQRGQYSIEGAPALVLGEPRVVMPASNPRLLVFVLVDTLRAQAVNADLTPQILEAFAGSRTYADTTANAPWTLPSVASLFTSRPVLDLTTPTGDMVGIPSGLDTWAAALRQAGFSGGAVVANYTVHVQNGFAQGFDTFVVPDILPPKGGLPDVSWVVEEGRRWLAAHQGEHGFLYLHLMDPHEPYRDHQNGGPRPDLFGLAHRKRQASVEERRHLRDLYEGEVRHVDRTLGPFLKSLPDHAELVFTSDHGEALGENGCWAHGFTLYQPVVQVPLMIRSSALAPGVESAPAQLLDLAPTVLDILGVAAPPTMEGHSLIHPGPQRAIVGATFSAGPMRWMWRRGDTKVVVRMEKQRAVTGDYLKASEEEDPLPTGFFCYDLRHDPDELKPESVPAEVLASVVEDYLASAGRLVPGLQVLSVGPEAGHELELAVEGGEGIRQLWSTGLVDVDRQGPTIRLTAGRTEPFFLAAIATDQIGEVTPGRADAPWRGLTPGIPAIPEPLGTDLRLESPGTLLWWNPERGEVVGSHDETMERLRALGYVQ